MGESTVVVSAETEDLALFVDNGERYLRSLRTVASSVVDARRRVAGATGHGPMSEGLAVDLAFDELVASAGHGNRFVGAVLDSLAGGHGTIDGALWDAGLLEFGDAGLSDARREALLAEVLSGVPVDSPLAASIVSRQIPAPTDTVRDRVAAAVMHGRMPMQVGIDPRYFPPSYREAVERFQWLPTEGAPRMDAENGPLGPTLPDRFLSDERQAALAAYGLVLDGDGEPDDENDSNRLLIIQETGSYLGEAWQGRKLAEWYPVEQPSHPFGTDPAGHDPLMVRRLAAQLADSTQVAVSFYNALGVHQAAGLPSVHPRQGRWGNIDRSTLHDFSTALANASRTGQLAFSGSELVEQYDVDYWAPHVSLLFSAGDFDRDFLADATVAQLRLHSENDRLVNSEFGSSATNVLLARAARSEETSAQVIRALGREGARHYLQPEHRFAPSVAADSYPITLLLGAAGRDPEMASLVLKAAASLEGGLSDAGVAGGIDAVMANHPTIMYDAGYLQDRGIDQHGRLSQDDWAALGLDGQDWKHLRSMVLQHGQGSGLAAANNGLIIEAIDHDLSNGRLGEKPDFYRLMALNAGALDEQWFQRVLEIRAEQDADGVRRNGYVAASISVGVALVGAAVLPLSSGGAAVGAAVGATTSVTLAQWPIEYWETDLTNAELRRRVTEQRGLHRLWQDAVTGPAVRAAQEAGQPIRFESGNILTIEDRGGVPMLISTDPRTGVETLNPSIRWHPDGRVGDERNDTISEIHAHYVDGQNLMDPNKAVANETSLRRSLRPWIVVPETGGG